MIRRGALCLTLLVACARADGTAGGKPPSPSPAPSSSAVTPPTPALSETELPPADAGEQDAPASLAPVPLASATPSASGAASSTPAPRPAPDRRWSTMRDPSPGPPAAIGGYSNGCLQGAVALPATGGPWVVMRPSRRRYFGHPSLVAFLERLGGAARKAKLAPIFVGDLAQPRGGPTLTGHASHQTGLDVDVQFVPPRDPARGPFTEQEREELPARAVVDLGTGKVTASFAPGVFRLVELAARDPATARVFVNPWLKKKLCDATAKAPREAWHGRVRPWWGHHDHFHVRLRCPEGSKTCEDQAALPPGDGCDASLAWWFRAEAKVPPPKKPDAPPPPLPAGCEALVPKEP